MKKIAFLFLINSNPNFPQLWDQYFNGKEDLYSIYIHAKNPNDLIWRRNNLILNLVETSYGFITRAYIALFKAAIENPSNYFFILISESCLPIQSFDSLYQNIITLNIDLIETTQLKTYDWNERINKQIKFALKENLLIPQCIIKHYSRSGLTLKSVQKLLEFEANGLLEFFHQMFVGDEFFLSVLFICNLTEPSYQFKQFAITHDDWNYTNGKINQLNKKIKNLYEKIEENKFDPINPNLLNKIKILQKEKRIISTHPKTIFTVESDLNQILTSKSYFYRKFDPSANIEKYFSFIIENHI